MSKLNSDVKQSSHRGQILFGEIKRVEIFRHEVGTEAEASAPHEATARAA